MPQQADSVLCRIIWRIYRFLCIINLHICSFLFHSILYCLILKQVDLSSLWLVNMRSNMKQLEFLSILLPTNALTSGYGRNLTSVYCIFNLKFETMFIFKNATLRLWLLISIIIYNIYYTYMSLFNLQLNNQYQCLYSRTRQDSGYVKPGIDH